ncbi:hypothetical protein AURDEDRAFT_186320 [Auricularia subglabra TFB-10046 SS5]|nr:hypothetical protein AURDEDRAFT_186320 [Auricularia subglabra TFB-10046 SS5]
MPRIRALKVFLPDAQGRSSASVRLLCVALAVPAAMLRDLHIVVRNDVTGRQTNRTTLEDALLAQYYVSLQTLRISGLGFSLSPGVVFANVREFCWSAGAPVTFDRTVLQSILLSMPCLKTLRISTRLFIWDTSCTLIRSSLAYVYLDPFKDVQNLIGFLRDTRLACVTARPPPGIKVSRHFFQALTGAASAVTFGDLMYEFTIALIGSVVRCPAQLRDRDLSGWTPVHSHNHLTSLTLHEYSWSLEYGDPSRGPTRTFAALEHLRISLANCPAYRLRQAYCRDGFGILQGIAGPLEAWNTPALRMLEISHYLSPESACTIRQPRMSQSCLTPYGCFCCRTLSICLEDVYRFVSTCIRFSQGRSLARICLNGVDVVDHNPVANFEFLERLADVVIVSPYPRPNSYDLGSMFRAGKVRYDRLDDEP